MPTMAAISWERLMDPHIRDSSSSPPPPPSQEEPRRASPPQPYLISPAVYAATVPASVSVSVSDSSPTSPYVVNRKRRDLRPPTALDGLELEIQAEVGVDQTDEIRPIEGCGRGGGGGTKEVDEDKGLKGGLEREEGADDEVDGFFDSREVVSYASSSEDGDSLRSSRPRSQTNRSEFYDASEDFFSDGSLSRSSQFSTNNEIELRALRLNLFEEIEKRKRAEETLLHMQNQWQRITKSVCQVGLSFPEVQHSENLQTEINPLALGQEIVVTGFVCEAVEKAIARAESEAVIEEVIESKNHEMSRLRDRLQYYEAMNREMSQRNQEVVESTRQQRLRRKTMRRWIWGSIGLSITIGASLHAYWYLSHDGKNVSPTAYPAESGEAEACLPE